MDPEQQRTSQAPATSSFKSAMSPSATKIDDTACNSSSSNTTKANPATRSYSPGGSSSSKAASTRSALAHTGSPKTGEKQGRMVRFAEEPSGGREEAKLQEELTIRRSSSPFRRQERQETGCDNEETQKELGPAVERGRTANRVPRRENVSEDSDSWKRRGRSRTPRKPIEVGNGSSPRM